MSVLPFNDQRCSERVLIRRPVKICPLATQPANTTQEPLAPKEYDWHSAQLIDLSSCGMGLLIDQALETYDYWLVSMSLPNYDNDAPLLLKAKITRTSKVRQQYLIGFEFLHLSAHDLIVIRDFFDYHRRFFA